MVTMALEDSATKKRFTEEQIIGILRKAEAPGAQIGTVVRSYNITETTCFR